MQIHPSHRIEGPASTATALDYWQTLVNELAPGISDKNTVFDATGPVLTIVGDVAYDQLALGGSLRNSAVAEIRRVGRPKGLPYMVADASTPGTVILALRPGHVEGSF
jgi:hypothetical protein